MSALAVRYRRHLLLALGFAAVLRLAAIAIAIDPLTAPDSHSFVSLAESFSQDGRLAYEDAGAPGTELRAFRSLFYPLFLWASGIGQDGFVIALVLQALLGVGVIALVFLVARRVLGPEVAAMTAWVGATYWTLLYYERQILTEPLYTFLLVGGVALALADFETRDRMTRRMSARVLLAGAVLGLASITRPAGLAAITALVTVWLAAAALSMRRAKTGGGGVRWLARIGLLILGSSLAVGPALYRNQAVLGKPVLLTSGGMNFWSGNGRGTITQAWTIMGERLPTYGEVAMDRWYYEDTWTHRAELTRETPRLLARKVWGFFAPSTREVEYLPLRLLLPFVLIGLILARPLKRLPAALVLSVVASQVVVGLAYVPDPRYRTPIDPFLWILAAAGIVALWRRGRVGRWAIPGLLGANLLALLLAHHMS